MYTTVRFNNGLMSLEEEFAWQTGAPLVGMRFGQVDGGWLLVVKTRSVQRGALVAFFGGRTPEECLASMWETAHTTAGIQWRTDKYA